MKQQLWTHLWDLCHHIYEALSQKEDTTKETSVSYVMGPIAKDVQTNGSYCPSFERSKHVKTLMLVP